MQSTPISAPRRRNPASSLLSAYAAPGDLVDQHKRLDSEWRAC